MFRFTVRLTDANGGGPKFNNLYFGGSTSATVIATKDSVVDFWAAIAVLMSDEVTWALDPIVFQIAPASGEVIETYDVGGAGSTGLSTGDPLPLASQGLLRINTDGIVANRRVRGRVFIPGLTETQTLGGRLTQQAAAAITQAAQQGLGSTSGSPFGVWSRPVPAGSSTPARDGSFHSANGFSTWQELAVLRSRRD